MLRDRAADADCRGDFRVPVVPCADRGVCSGAVCFGFGIDSQRQSGAHGCTCGFHSARRIRYGIYKGIFTKIILGKGRNIEEEIAARKGNKLLSRHERV